VTAYSINKSAQQQAMREDVMKVLEIMAERSS
jgi:hypothetical protein